MQLSRMYFEKFATVISDNMDHAKKYDYETIMIKEIAYDLADVLEGSDELFYRDKFLKDCGVC